MICAINCGQIILIQLIFCFHIFHYFFHYFHYFYHHYHYSHFAAKSGTYLFMTLLCCSEMCSHSSISFNISCVVLFLFLWGPQTIWFVILHLECSTQKFWGVCVTQQHLGDIWVIFRSPRITYYTGNTFGFNVNISHLYSVKPSNYSSLILSYILYCFSCRIPCIGLWYFCCIYMDYHCTDVGTLI